MFVFVSFKSENLIILFEFTWPWLLQEQNTITKTLIINFMVFSFSYMADLFLIHGVRKLRFIKQSGVALSLNTPDRWARLSDACAEHSG